MKQIHIRIQIDSLSLKEFEEWYDERMCDFKDFDEFLITMAYHGMKDDQRRAKKKNCDY